MAAAALRIPLVVHEQNAVPGAANRAAARFAAACAVSFEGTPLPRATVTGNPVRAEILAVDRSPESRAAARAQLQIPEGRVVVGVFGGSLGARRINDAVLGLVRRWLRRGDVAVRHVVGERDWDEVTVRLPEPPPGGLVYQPVRYEDRMELLLTAADVAVCRSGGTTVAELAVVGVPSILVPLPIAPGDHQTANARALVEAGGALLLPDGEATSDRLASELEELMADPRTLPAMGEAAASLGRRDAAHRVADLLERHARR